MKTPHPHKDLICQWAEDTSLLPEIKIESQWGATTIEMVLKYPFNKFRIKPKMISLNGFEYPEALKEAPPEGTVCWYAGAASVYSCFIESNRASFLSLLKQRRLHITHEAAQMHFEAIIKAGGGEV